MLSLNGCGDGRLSCYPVTGTVMVDGKPYPGAEVLLRPVAGGDKLQKERPYGVTDELGTFELTTFLKNDGAPAGEYQVMILSKRPRSKEQDLQWKGRPTLDAKYGKLSTSGIVVVVEAGPTELSPFELKAAKRGRR